MTETIIPPLLSAKDVAELLSIPVSTLRKNVSANPTSIPPFLKLGRASNSPVRWRRSDVDAWIQTRFDANNSTDDFTSLLTKSEVKI